MITLNSLKDYPSKTPLTLKDLLDKAFLSMKDTQDEGELNDYVLSDLDKNTSYYLDVESLIEAHDKTLVKTGKAPGYLRSYMKSGKLRDLIRLDLKLTVDNDVFFPETNERRSYVHFENDIGISHTSSVTLLEEELANVRVLTVRVTP